MSLRHDGRKCSTLIGTVVRPAAQEACCCLRTGPIPKVSPLNPMVVRFPRRFLLSPVRHHFSATHFPGHCFRLIPAPGSFASSAFSVPLPKSLGPSHKAASRFGSRSPRFWVPQENGARKRRFTKCLTYMLSGIALRGGPLVDVPVIRAWLSCPGHSRSEDCDAGGGALRS